MERHVLECLQESRNTLVACYRIISIEMGLNMYSHNIEAAIERIDALMAIARKDQDLEQSKSTTNSVSA